MRNDKSISVCMICKNEEKRLESLFMSISALADEIIFVDTGSNDNSVGIAKRFGARVFHYVWDDDFSGPKNFALQHAKSIYVLCLDCDDYLSEESIIAIKQFVYEGKAEGCYIRYESKVVHGKQVNILVDYKLTLFRNRKEFEFRGRIHETVEDSMAEHLDLASIPVSDITIYHNGYENVTTMKAKHERNLRIINRALTQTGDNPFLRYCEGICYLGLNQYDHALKTFFPLKRKWTCQHPLYSDVLYKIINCMFETRKWDEAKRELNFAFGIYPDFTDLYYILACVDYNLDNYKEARNLWFSCLDLGDAPSNYMYLKGAGSCLAWRGIMLTFFKEKKYKMAVKASIQFISKHFNWHNTFNMLSDIFDLFPKQTILHFAEAAEEQEEFEFAYALLTLGIKKEGTEECQQSAIRLLCKMVDKNE